MEEEEEEEEEEQGWWRGHCCSLSAACPVCRSEAVLRQSRPCKVEASDVRESALDGSLASARGRRRRSDRRGESRWRGRVGRARAVELGDEQQPSWESTSKQETRKEHVLMRMRVIVLQKEQAARAWGQQKHGERARPRGVGAALFTPPLAPRTKPGLLLLLPPIKPCHSAAACTAAPCPWRCPPPAFLRRAKTRRNARAQGASAPWASCQTLAGRAGGRRA
jgi:hypothetical protein